MQVKCAGRSTSMSANLLTPHTMPHLESMRAVGFPKSGPRLVLTVSVNATRQRIFQVLTIPEYMETWLALPEHAHGLHIAVTGYDNAFRIDCGGAQQSDFSFSGLFRTCRRGKLEFSWMKSGLGELRSSLVSIRLYGDFARTRLCLVHSGLKSARERSWHQEMWNRSLHRLCSLF